MDKLEKQEKKRLRCAVKFCGGCNPRYDRGAAYQTIRDTLSETVSFSYPQDGVSYDLLLMIRGCTGCSYLYEEIPAAYRCVLTDGSQDAIHTVLQDMKNICQLAEKEETI